MEGSNLRFLIQSQASYHWTNPQSARVVEVLLRPGAGRDCFAIFCIFIVVTGGQAVK